MAVKFKENVSLAALNTLGVPSVSNQFYEIFDETSLASFSKFVSVSPRQFKILGGGSNLVLGSLIHDPVIKVSMTGIHLLKEELDSVLLSVKAGEIWHDFVAWSLNQGYSGLENLALIPGTVGASPVQNIGAYGVEVCQLIESVSAIDLTSGQTCSFKKDDCVFAYRDSIFKKLENRYLITDVVFKLNKSFKPVLEYGPLKVLKDKPDLTAIDVFTHVVEIRNEKLPDPQALPNAGSFFQNPIISLHQFKDLKERYPEVVSYELEEGVKLAAGWLIDQAGLKGQANDSGVGCFKKQALVLINPNRASASSVMSWANHVQQIVFERFGVLLQIEPRQW